MCKDAALLGGGEAQLQTAERRAPPGWALLCAQRYWQAWDLGEAGAGPSEPVGAPVSEWRGLCGVLRGPFLGLWLRRLCQMTSHHSVTPPDPS